MSRTIVLTDEDYRKVQNVLSKAEPVVEKKKGVTIYKIDGSVFFESDKETVREAVIKKCEDRGADLRVANLCGANLRGANLCGADLCGAELASVKFYGKGGTTRIKKSQVDDFFKALGIIVEA